MAVRRESIILELEDNASAEALRAAAALKTLDKAISGLSGSAIRSHAFQTTARDVDKMGASFDRAGSSIDRFSGRAALLGTALTTIGPAAIPITAAAVPALVTLTAGLGAAASAAGVLMLAFDGVGEAVTAVSNYRLAPTAENLAKVREEMDRLGPSGASFVMAIDKATPALEDLQRTARDGIFPGWERGLDELMTQLPGVRNFVADLSATVGELGEASADALVNDADWQEFFDLIGTDGPSALEDFGRATGNVVAGAANLAEALSELTGNRAGLVENSRAFREWADNLEHTEGFQEFADYIRESGPEVAEFLTATGEAMVAVAQAAAPWGQAVLPALTALADVTAAIAGSPLGPPLFAAAAAMLVFNKAAAASSAIMGRIAPSVDGVRTSLGQMKSDLGTVAGGWVLASSATERESKKMAAAQARLKAVASEAARTGPALAAMGLLATGSADKMGLTNTAVLALAGSMAGPWGTAAGAAVGLTMDLAAANDDLAEATENANAAMKSGGLTELTAQAKALKETLRETTDSDVLGFDMIGAGFINAIAPLSNVQKLMSGLTGETDKAGKALEKIQAQKAGMEGLAVALGANRNSAEQMSSGVDRAQTAMKALGISSGDLVEAQKAGGPVWDMLTGRIQAWIQTADSTEGRTEAVGDAIADLGNDALSTAASADALAAALQGLISPEQDLIGAQDAMSSTLNGLKDQIDGTNKSLLGTSDAAIKNRAAISGGVTAINNLAAAQAAAGESSLTVASTMNTQRQALINAGQAAGLSRRQVEALVNQMGLTPDVVRTAFEAAGIEGVSAKTQALTARFNALPKRLQTDIATNGIPKSEADISRLQAKYKLTPAQVRTLASLRDNASGPIAAVIAALRAADGQSATTTITTRRITEIITISSGQSTRPDRRVMPGSTSANGGLYRNGVKAFADGGYGMDGRYYTRQPQILPGGANILWGEKETGWEAYISGKPSEKQRNLDILAMAADRLGAMVLPAAAGHITAYAKGGSTGRGSGTGSRSMESWAKMWDRAAKTTERALDDHKKQLQRATDRLDYWNQKRDALKSEVSGSLTRNWFEGGSTDPWSGGLQGGTVAYAQDQWKQQAGDSKKLMATVANLKKNGASDAFIAEILRSPDPLAAAQMFNKQSVAGMRHSQSLYLSATRATASAASYTSGVVYGDEIAKARGDVAHIRGDIKHLGALLKKQHKEAQESRNRNSPRKAAAKGARSRK